MRPIGFSTGSLMPGQVRRALEILAPHATTAIELSALRMSELPELLAGVEAATLDGMKYISFHSPSRWQPLSDRDMLIQLQPMIERGWPIIVHPDVITDWEVWARLGSQLVVENMDGRKPMGRTVQELEAVFRKLPQARFCFDVGHAYQMDSHQRLGNDLLAAYGDRLVEIHLSEVNDDYTHQPMSEAFIDAVRPLLVKCPAVPIILETPVVAETLGQQLQLARF
ncbi:MAG TPA: TIM barrel protein [Gemmatales bacterium]|nr:TIM barrel protein [Gemmatales bacterium]